MNEPDYSAYVESATIQDLRAQLAVAEGREKRLRDHIKAIDHDADGAFMPVPVAWFRYLAALAEGE